MLTVTQVADRYSVRQHTVLAWIRSGELVAVNVGANPRGKKPRWRISEAALADFERLRGATAATTAGTTSQRRHAIPRRYY